MTDLPEKDFEDWVKAPDAFKRAREKYGNIGDAASVLFNRLKDGLLYSAAADLVAGDSRSKFVFVKVDHWKAIEHLPSGCSFWTTGEIAIKVGRYRPHDRLGSEYSYYDVRFNSPQLDKLLGPVESLVPEEAQPIDAASAVSPRHAGGAPAKPFWDDLWAAIGALIYRGTLRPDSKQKDIEDAMVQWATDNDHDLSIQSARPRARKLLAELRKAEKDNN